MALYNRHHHLLQKHFITPKGKSVPIKPSWPLSPPPAPGTYYSALCLWACLSWIFHIHGIIPHVAFGVLFLMLSVRVSRYIHTGARHQYFMCWYWWLYFIPEQYSVVWIDHVLFIRSSGDGHFSGFYLLAIGNGATMNILVQTLFEHLFSILGGKHLGLKLLDHKAILCLTFWGNSPKFFPQQLYHFTCPQIVHKGSNFSMSSLTLVLFPSFLL